MGYERFFSSNYLYFTVIEFFFAWIRICIVLLGSGSVTHFFRSWIRIRIKIIRIRHTAGGSYRLPVSNGFF